MEGGELMACDINRSYPYLLSSVVSHARTPDALDWGLPSNIRRLRQEPRALRYNEALYPATTPANSYGFTTEDQARQCPRPIDHPTQARLRGSVNEFYHPCRTPPSQYGGVPTSLHHHSSPSSEGSHGHRSHRYNSSCNTGDNDFTDKKIDYAEYTELLHPQIYFPQSSVTSIYGDAELLNGLDDLSNPVLVDLPIYQFEEEPKEAENFIPNEQSTVTYEEPTASSDLLDTVRFRTTKNFPKVISRGNIITKFDFPYFDGDSYIEDYLDWEHKVDKFFDNIDIPQGRQVRYVVRKLTGRAGAWWMHLTQARRHEGRRDVKTWSKMKCMLREQFLSPYYENQSLGVGSKDGWKDGFPRSSKSVERLAPERALGHFLASLVQDNEIQSHVQETLVMGDDEYWSEREVKMTSNCIPINSPNGQGAISGYEIELPVIEIVPKFSTSDETNHGVVSDAIGSLKLEEKEAKPIITYPIWSQFNFKERQRAPKMHPSRFLLLKQCKKDVEYAYVDKISLYGSPRSHSTVGDSPTTPHNKKFLHIQTVKAEDNIPAMRKKSQLTVEDSLTIWPWYYDKMMETNPSSIAILNTLVNSTFRLFVYCKTSLLGFEQVFRSLIFLDRTPLKSINQCKVLAAAFVAILQMELEFKGPLCLIGDSFYINKFTERFNAICLKWVKEGSIQLTFPPKPGWLDDYIFDDFRKSDLHAKAFSWLSMFWRVVTLEANGKQCVVAASYMGIHLARHKFHHSRKFWEDFYINISEAKYFIYVAGGSVNVIQKFLHVLKELFLEQLHLRMNSCRIFRMVKAYGLAAILRSG